MRPFLFLKACLLKVFFVFAICPVAMAEKTDAAWHSFLSGNYAEASEFLEKDTTGSIEKSSYLKFLLSEAYLWNQQMPYSREEGLAALASIDPVEDVQAINDLQIINRISFRFAPNDEIEKIFDLVSIAKENPTSNYAVLLAEIVTGKHFIEDGGAFKEEVWKRFPEFDGMTTLQIFAFNFGKRKDTYSALSLAFHLARYYLYLEKSESKRELDPDLIKDLEDFANRGNFEIYYVLRRLYEGETTTIEADYYKALKYALLGRKAGTRTKDQYIDLIRDRLTPSEIQKVEEEVDQIYEKMLEDGSPYAETIAWCEATFAHQTRLNYCREFSPLHHMICKKKYPEKYRDFELGTPYQDCRWGYVKSLVRPFQREKSKN
ncbi:MAG: hypothetical protein NXI13_12840 [Proteobacteria bacterium]|nr:hypothetical protein [Pseudomonadota bacterium]